MTRQRGDGHAHQWQLRAAGCQSAVGYGSTSDRLPAFFSARAMQGRGMREISLIFLAFEVRDETDDMKGTRSWMYTACEWIT